MRDMDEHFGWNWAQLSIAMARRYGAWYCKALFTASSDSALTAWPVLHTHPKLGFNLRDKGAATIAMMSDEAKLFKRDELIHTIVGVIS